MLGYDGKKHRSQYFSNCYYCEHANPDGEPCSKDLHLEVAIWRNSDVMKRRSGPRGMFPFDKKTKGCPGFTLSKICVIEDRDVTGKRVSKREMFD